MFSRRSRPESPVSRDPDAMLASRGVGFIALTMQCRDRAVGGLALRDLDRFRALIEAPPNMGGPPCDGYFFFVTIEMECG